MKEGDSELMTWIIVLLAVDGALFLAIFAVLARIEQRLTHLEKKKARSARRATKKSSKSVDF
ncbi:hypothetical protein [Sulfobacillus thermosulfidooxidans]|uniref:CcmD family protein n=1 Tax=Sulfobacillus thermosulfidooxidans (strain DSM 9293 / VKM B-1269 / AT-1) TaxID=929705 RepID=A0A1W1W991_SULTA|nr:hypothetical protein [Sulfobacillus thermosulfidooxidans]OLZ10837.1 hypothetical protein BFX05_08740 [Sulfobacillus thermosulfidooxidans]OLZ14325.1 hypothetical protein BFX06_08565 [Sulfobacillus thermosulfidooxidans]OLZ19068.1 hypothetical protein BFX07_04960 [Sulfobacillus thermosulfidooxidans]SMC02610.1 hypothetical protein SAMN00768000_0680 [Sulfobacillus thermosulfidooxidans DSM 9293]